MFFSNSKKFLTFNLLIWNITLQLACTSFSPPKKDSTKKALITGITGQDGSYLAEFLLSKGYQVHGLVRRSATSNFQNIDAIREKLFLHDGDLSDFSTISKIICSVKPDEIYNLGGQTDVGLSFNVPEYTGNITGLGALRMLEAIRQSQLPIKFYQATSSEIFGLTPPPQNEETPFHPRSPYGVAKLYAYWITVNYRESYGIFACNGILFNHESPRRGSFFVTKKISQAVAAILTDKQDKLYLGNLDAKRDWGFASEYVEAMWLILQQENPGDFVIGSGQSHTVREFVEKAFAYTGIEIAWIGSGIHEKGIIKNITQKSKQAFSNNLKQGDIIIEINPKFFRPAEVDHLMANIEKAKIALNWQPRISFDDLVNLMVDDDVQTALATHRKIQA